MGNKVSKKKIAQQKAEAERKADKRSKYNFLIYALAMLVVMWVVGYFFNGTSIKDVPVQKNIASVEITNTTLSTETKIFTDEDNIKNACAALGLLRFKYGTVAEEEPTISMVFNMDDGTTKAVYISENTLTWNGETYKIVRDSMVRDIINAFFFPEFVKEK